MPRIDAVVESRIARSFRVEQVAGMFDLPADAGCRERFSVELPATDEMDSAGKPGWQIGLIVGASGSGKTTIARRAFGAAALEQCHKPWPHDAAVVDGFGDCAIRDMTRMFAAVGFSSPPAWLRPYHVLSNGEKFRCDLARLLLTTCDGPGGCTTGSAGAVAVMDEFTSVVDRTVAKVCSVALAKAIRSGLAGAQRFVGVSCHYDIIEWLCPDWVLDMSDGKLTRRLLRRKPIRLEVRRCGFELWRMFKRHHYLSSHLPAAMRCYVGVIEDRPAAFAVISPVLGFAGYRRFGRIVVLPDYQGIGIGGAFRDAIARIEAHLPDCRRLSLVTSHPAMVRSCIKSGLWRVCEVRHARDQAIMARRRAGGKPHVEGANHTRLVCSLVYRSSALAVECEKVGGVSDAK